MSARIFISLAELQGFEGKWDRRSACRSSAELHGSQGIDFCAVGQCVTATDSGQTQSTSCTHRRTWTRIGTSYGHSIKTYLPTILRTALFGFERTSQLNSGVWGGHHDAFQNSLGVRHGFASSLVPGFLNNTICTDEKFARWAEPPANQPL
jgi:hypothetical protein